MGSTFLMKSASSNLAPTTIYIMNSKIVRMDYIKKEKNIILVDFSFRETYPPKIFPSSKSIVHRTAISILNLENSYRNNILIRRSDQIYL